jgi:glutamate/tyrosine decarboxylase-like PLP-dependent enzyme
LYQYNDDETALLLRQTTDHALDFLSNVAARPVAGRPEPTAFHADPTIPEVGEDPRRVIETLVHAADPGLVANNGPRYFGFVTGGSLPVALAADWLTSAWDQNACLQVMSPAAASIEALAPRWLIQLFGLP